jgi:TPP-dependent trihydroxycyclohexane-1,2-dione (THcHDO) dehydratase
VATDVSGTRRRRRAIVTGMLFRFLETLPKRPDATRCRAALARAFVQHRAEILLHADDEYCFRHADDILQVMAQMHDKAVEVNSVSWLERNRWLVDLVRDLDQGKARLDA